MSIRIAAANWAVPDRVETTAELSGLLGVSGDWLLETTGVHQRHVADDNLDPAELAAQVAAPIIRDRGKPDLLLNFGVIPRQAFPETGLFIHRALGGRENEVSASGLEEIGLGGIPCFSVNAACLSFLVALDTASALIARGGYRNVLLVGAELASGGRNFQCPESAALLGDGAAAAWVEASPPDEGDGGGLQFEMKSWSDGLELAAVRGGGTMRNARSDVAQPGDDCFSMQGNRLLRKTVPRLKHFLNAFLERHQTGVSEIDCVIPHQPSGPGLELLGRWGFRPDQVVNIVGQYGNCVSASMPMALAMALQEGRLRDGDKVLFLGTAAGVSVAAGLLRW